MLYRIDTSGVALVWFVFAVVFFNTKVTEESMVGAVVSLCALNAESIVSSA